jgi:hypothetical protein
LTKKAGENDKKERGSGQDRTKGWKEKEGGRMKDGGWCWDMRNMIMEERLFWQEVGRE